MISKFQSYSTQLAAAPLDFAGAVVATACALHCALLPLAVAILPALIPGSFIEASEGVILGSAFLFGTISSVRSVVQHRIWKPPVFIAAGLLLLAGGIVAGSFGNSVLERITHFCAAGLLITGHLQSLKVCRHCAECASGGPTRPN